MTDDLDFYHSEFIRLGYSTIDMTPEYVDKWISLLMDRIEELEAERDGLQEELEMKE